MPLHQNLTGADLHEPKGADSASADTVYVSDGAGSGSWSKVGVSQINATSVKNVNKEQLVFEYPDIGTASSRYLGLSKACTLTGIRAIVQVATATSATVLTIRNDAGTSMGTISIPSGALAGSMHTLSPVSNNTFTAGQKLQIDTDGGTSTTSPVSITLELTWT